MITLKAKLRTVLGKKVKALRQEGYVPAIVYGGGEEPLPISVFYNDFEKVFRTTGESSLVDLEVDSKRYNVLVKDVAYDPVTDRIIAVDFFRVPMDQEIEIEISLNFVGTSPAVKELDGVLVKVTHEIRVAAIPMDLPGEIEVDISKLFTFEDRILAKNLTMPKGVRLVGDEKETVALVEAPIVEAEEEVEKPDMDKIEVVGKEKEGEKEGIESEQGTKESAEGKSDK